MQKLKSISLLIAVLVGIPACYLTIVGFVAESHLAAQYSPPTGPIKTAPPVTLTAAQIDGMYATPVLVIPAQGPGSVVKINGCVFNAIYGGTAFSAGGSIGLYYGNVSPPVSLSSGTALTTFLTTFSANQIITFGTASGGVQSIVASSIAINAPIYISNATAPFTGGTGASMIVKCTYYVVSGVQ